ncbi:MAG: hypothetical protein ACK5LE_09355 [Alphaproteobacteria bacterium]
MRKLIVASVIFMGLGIANAELPFAPTQELVENINKENKSLPIELANLPLQIYTMETLGANKQNSEYLFEYVAQYPEQMSEEQLLRIMTPFMDMGDKRALKEIVNIAKGQLAVFSQKDGQIDCRSDVYQGLIALKMDKELSDIVALVDHPICDIQFKLLQNSAQNNQRPSDKLWKELSNNVAKMADATKKEQGYEYIAQEMLNYEAWDAFAETILNIMAMNERFNLYAQYFNAVDLSGEIPQKAHKIITENFQKDINAHGLENLREAALALQSAGYVPQLQTLIEHDLANADDRLILRLVTSFAQSDSRLYAENTMQFIDNPFVRAKAWVAMAEYLGTQPLAGDDAYLDQAIQTVNGLDNQLQRDDIYKDLSLIALRSGAADTALALAQQIQGDNMKYAVFTQLAIDFSETGNEQAAEQIVHTILPPALNLQLLDQIFPNHDYNPWLNIMVVYSPVEAIETQLQIIGGNADENRSQAVDILLNYDITVKAESLIDNIENPWLQAEKYLYLCSYMGGNDALVEKATQLLQNSIMVGAGPYLESITSSLYALGRQDLIGYLYNNAPSAAERMPILTAMLLSTSVAAPLAEEEASDEINEDH